MHFSASQTDYCTNAEATAAQYRLGRTRRAENVGNAFRCRPEHVAAVRGRHVVLFDDIVTTGSTLAACALTLRDGGAASVSGLAVARVR